VPADSSTTNGHTFSAKRESGDGRPASRDAQCTVGAAPKAAKHTDPSHWVGRIPRDGARHPVSDPLGVVVAVQMARRLRKRHRPAQIADIYKPFTRGDWSSGLSPKVGSQPQGDLAAQRQYRCQHRPACMV